MTKIIKRVLTFLAVVLIIIVGWELITYKIQNPFRIKSMETMHSIILKEIKTMGNLELASYHFKDIVEHKLVRDYLPDPKALLIVFGEATGCLDLTKISAVDISTKGDTIYVQMPRPSVCHFKIDHSKSKIYDSDYAFMNEQLLFDEAYKAAEKKLYETAVESGLLQTTQENAHKVLEPLFGNISGKPVVLKFDY